MNKMTVMELQKARIVLKQTDPARSSAYGRLVDAAKKEGKKENRMATEADILLAAKRGVKSAIKAQTDVTESNTYKDLRASLNSELTIEGYDHTQGYYDIQEKDMGLLQERAILENEFKDIAKFLEDSIIEIGIYEEFLPEMATEDDIRRKISNSVASLSEDQRNMKSMGRVVGELKRTFGDSVDMGLASKLIKEALA